jgi:hypothetical protein
MYLHECCNSGWEPAKNRAVLAYRTLLRQSRVPSCRWLLVYEFAT